MESVSGEPQVYPRTQHQPINNQVKPVMQPPLSQAQIQAAPGLLVHNQDNQDSPNEENKLSSVDILDEASLRGKQAP